jgi:hypothetical protein
MNGRNVQPQTSIFNDMKARAYMVLILWCIVLVEPVTANLPVESTYSSCADMKKAEPSCAASTCDKPADKEEEDNDCGNDRCNPIMSCPAGNFYLSGHSVFSFAAYVPAKQKKDLVNDNRILKYMAECWHPPEVI